MSDVLQVIFPADNKIGALLEDYRWVTNLGETTQITFSFPSGNDTVWANSYDSESDTWSALSSGEQEQARTIFDLWASVANISFQEVSDQASSVGDIRFSHSDIIDADGATVAWAYLPYPRFSEGSEAAEASGDIWLNKDDYSTGAGSYNYLTLMHEVGHALGLSHPHDGRVLMPSVFDNGQYSVMSYNEHPDGILNGHSPLTPMLYDIAAIQYLYGANTDYKTGDDVYLFSADGEIQTIWDAGGNDTFDFSLQTQGVLSFLRAGTFSSAGYLENAQQKASNNIAIAFDVDIENVIGSRYDDYLVANSADNLLTGGLGNDVLVGENGGDIAVFDVAYADASIVFSDDSIEITSSEGIDTLITIEAIQFSDGIVSLLTQDLPTTIVGEDLVGRVVSLYQAALNREPDSGGLNFWVNSYIQGFDLLTISQNFVHSTEFTTNFSVNSNADYLNTLYQNVLGRAGDTGGVEFWLNALNAGHSYAQVLLDFSDSPENQHQVASLLDTLTYQAADGLWIVG